MSWDNAHDLFVCNDHYFDELGCELVSPVLVCRLPGEQGRAQDSRRFFEIAALALRRLEDAESGDELVALGEVLRSIQIAPLVQLFDAVQPRLQPSPFFLLVGDLPTLSRQVAHRLVDRVIGDRDRAQPRLKLTLVQFPQCTVPVVTRSKMQSMMLTILARCLSVLTLSFV